MMTNDDKRREILRAVKHGRSIAEALLQLKKLEPKETIKVQLTDADDPRAVHKATVLKEIVVDHLVPEGTMIHYIGQRFLVSSFPDIYVDGDEVTWVVKAWEVTDEEDNND